MNQTLPLKYDFEIIGSIHSSTLREFMSAVRNHDLNVPFTICICSNGGDADTAKAIHDMIELTGLTVHAYCMGAVESAGMTILHAAHMKFATPTCTFMQHRSLPNHNTFKNRQELKWKTNNIDTLNAKWLNVHKINRKPHYFTAQQAVQQGIIDKVLQ